MFLVTPKPPSDGSISTIAKAEKDFPMSMGCLNDINHRQERKKLVPCSERRLIINLLQPARGGARAVPDVGRGARVVDAFSGTDNATGLSYYAVCAIADVYLAYGSLRTHHRW